MNKKKVVISILIVVLLLVVVGVSYAYIMLQRGQTTSNIIKSTCLKLDIVDVNNAINLDPAYPISDVEAESLTPYKFRIVNKCDINTSYTIKLDVLNTEDKLKNEYVSVSLDNGTKNVLTNLSESSNIMTYDDYTVDKSYILMTDEVAKNESKEYDLRIWMNASAGNDAMNKTFLSKISIDAYQSENQLYVDKELNGTDPVIKDGLVPVTIANDGTVKKADLNSKWYSYEESKWANAVILNEADNYKEGEIIPNSAIESYFVWIPKYRYKLFNVEGNKIEPQEIEIEFGTTNTVDSETECIATNKSGDNGTCENGKWMTHPAFTSLGVNGIWVGKFETTGTVDKVTVKPNETSLRSINVSTMYNTSYNYKRSLDSHMMKNTEWGAIAYLTNSKYGRGNTEVWLNNSSTYITGCAGESVSASEYNGCQNAYNTGLGYHASTTDNISGIYDTSGGAWEYVMGNHDNKEVSSGINPSILPDKYIDRYIGTDLNSKILGDTISESIDWNEDFSDFNSSSGPWLRRGGSYSNNYKSGIFAVHHNNGDPISGNTFRIVLS